MATVRREVLAMVRRAKLSTDALRKSSYVTSTSRPSIMGGKAPVPVLNYECRRWYTFLPPQLHHIAADYLDKAGISLAADWATPGLYPVHDAEINPLAVRSAKFAIKAQNNSSASQDKLRFMRVLRASSSHSVSTGGHKYYVTFEALRGKADVDVYYAEVVHGNAEVVKSKGESKVITQMELVKSQLVDHSFSYPRDQIRYAVGDSVKLHDPESIINGILKAEGCLPEDLDMDIPPAKAIFDINTFEDVSKLALFAVTTHNKNEDDKVHLKNVLWACKSKVQDNWIYRLVLEAMNGEKELAYYAIVKASDDSSLELMEWYLIPGTFLDHGEVAEQNPASKVGSDS